MSPILKFVGGFILGSALGAGSYVVLTQDNENGLIAEIKTFANTVVDQGKQAADAKRMELRVELGQKPVT